MNKFFSTAFLCVLLISLSGCAKTWHATKNFYNTYIDPPATYEMNDEHLLTGTDEVLASNLMLIGTELSSFRLTISNLQLPPTGADVDSLLLQFPWIDGITLINELGYVTGALPTTYPSYIDFSSLLSYEGEDKRATRVIVQKSYDVNTMLVGIPAFDNNGNLMGVFIVYFNLAEFFEYMEMSPYVFVLAKNEPVWFGTHNIDETPLAGVDFVKKVSSKSDGKVSNEYGKAEWINYYFYDFPIIFAIMQEK